jgi:hypothetical protein
MAGMAVARDAIISCIQCGHTVPEKYVAVGGRSVTHKSECRVCCMFCLFFLRQRRCVFHTQKMGVCIYVYLCAMALVLDDPRLRGPMHKIRAKLCNHCGTQSQTHPGKLLVALHMALVPMAAASATTGMSLLFLFL